MRTSHAGRNPLKTRLNDVKARLSLAVFLLFTLGLFVSWSLAAEGTPGTETSNVSKKEQADRPTHPYQDYALFIAGISNPKGSLACLGKQPGMGPVCQILQRELEGPRGEATYADEAMGRPGAQRR